MLRLKASKEVIKDQAQEQKQNDFSLEHFDIYFYMYIGGSILSLIYFAIEYSFPSRMLWLVKFVLKK